MSITTTTQIKFTSLTFLTTTESSAPKYNTAFPHNSVSDGLTVESDASRSCENKQHLCILPQEASVVNILYRANLKNLKIILQIRIEYNFTGIFAITSRTH